jgi:hypothetical protein
MSYYKIVFESDTFEGLTAILGSSPGQGASGTNSTNSENSVPPPPLQQYEESVEALSSIVQAPPLADEAGFYFSDENAIQSPPPMVADLVTTDIDSEVGIQPPPNDELQNQKGNEVGPDEGLVPPTQPSNFKISKAAKKSSK